MMNQATEIIGFLRKNVPKHPADIVEVTTKHFRVTRTTVHRHLTKLIDRGEVIKTGKTRDVLYYLANSMNRRAKFHISDGIEESKVYNRHLKSTFSHLPGNIELICRYGFTEIFNNAIEHSRGTKIWIESDLIENNPSCEFLCHLSNRLYSRNFQRFNHISSKSRNQVSHGISD